MIQLTLPWIKTYAGSDHKFKAGFMLHQKQCIKSVEAGARNSLVLAMEDFDGIKQHTTLFFYQDTGTFRYSKCSCHQNQPCQHVVGSLLYVLYKKEALTETLSQNKTNKMYDTFEALLMKPSTIYAKKHLSLEVIISPRDVYSKVQSSSVQLKVILNNPYLVKHVENFVNAVVEGKSYEIARNLIYKPGAYVFDAIDQKIIHLLYDYYRTRSHMLQSGNSQVLTSLKTSVQSLPGTYIARLLELVNAHHFNIDYDGLFFRHQHIEEHLEIDFYLTHEQGDYTLSVNTYDIFFPMTEDYYFVFYNNQVYQINEREKDAFKLFYHYLSDKIMGIGHNHIEDFINKVKPVLELIGFIHLDPSINERLVT